VYRKSTTINEILTELRESLVENIVEEVMKPENKQRFPNYREIYRELLKWYITLSYQLVATTVRSRDRSIIPAYAQEIAYRRYLYGFGSQEVKDFIHLIGKTMRDALLLRPELKGSKQKVDDYIILTSQMMADEFEDVYESLQSQSKYRLTPHKESEKLTSTENIKQIVRQLEEVHVDRLSNRSSTDVSFKDYGVMITLSDQNE
jgi:hypothetical protein